MPYKQTKLKSGKVKVTSPHGTKSHGSTVPNAKKQVRLLNAVEHNPEFRKKLKEQIFI